MHIFRDMCIEGYIFLQHCSSGWGGHKIFDHLMGGHKNIAEVLSEIYDSPIPKKMVTALGPRVREPNLIEKHFAELSDKMILQDGFQDGQQNPFKLLLVHESCQERPYFDIHATLDKF